MRVSLFIFIFECRVQKRRGGDQNQINPQAINVIYIYMSYIYIYIYIYGAHILDVSRSHTTTQHSRQDSSERVITSSQGPLPDNTRHSQQTNIHALGGIRTQDLSRRAAAGADPQATNVIYIYIYIYIYMEHPFLVFLDHTQRRSTVGRTPLDE